MGKLGRILCFLQSLHWAEFWAVGAGCLSLSGVGGEEILTLLPLGSSSKKSRQQLLKDLLIPWWEETSVSPFPSTLPWLWSLMNGGVRNHLWAVVPGIHVNHPWSCLMGVSRERKGNSAFCVASRRGCVWFIYGTVVQRWLLTVKEVLEYLFLFVCFFYFYSSSGHNWPLVR